MIDPYFDLQHEININIIEDLLSYNIKKQYYKPGSTEVIKDVVSSYQFPHITGGLFRGQICDYSLIPKCFRKVDLLEDFSKWSDVQKSFAYIRSISLFRGFCERAEAQNPDFPKAEIDRMSIAQHYGVHTPLLDWSQNIFTAIFFAVREIFSNPKFEKDFSIYIYHIIDERLLGQNTSVKDLSDMDESLLIQPFHIDRRIERQKGKFSFHPHPSVAPKKIPFNRYIVKKELVLKLWKLMDGFGFTEDYYFPDYSGIADSTTNDTSL